MKKLTLCIALTAAVALIGQAIWLKRPRQEVVATATWKVERPALLELGRLADRPVDVPPEKEKPAVVPVADKVIDQRDLRLPTANVLPLEQKAGGAEAFAGFPTGMSRELAFVADEQSFNQLTPRERRDQLRDWALFTVVGDAGLSVDEVNRVLFDVPPLRNRYLQPLGNLEFGETRSCSIGNGRVIALIPPGSAKKQLDYLAHIADEQRKNTGEIPETLVVFECDLKLESFSAQVTRRPDQAGRELYTEKAGYFQMIVDDRAGVESLMAKIDGLTYAKLSDQRFGGLHLGGRKLQDVKYRGIGVQDVAAIWQTYADITKAEESFKRWVKNKDDEFKREWDKRFENFNAEWRAKQLLLPPIPQPAPVPGFDPFGFPRKGTRPGFPIRQPPPPQGEFSVEAYLKLLRSKDLIGGDPLNPIGGLDPIGETFKRQHAAAVAEIRAEEKRASEALNETIRTRQQELRDQLVPGAGFSLDPHYDYAGLGAAFALLRPQFAEVARKDPALIDLAKVERAAAGFRNQDILPFLILKEAIREKLDGNLLPLFGDLRSKELTQMNVLERKLAEIELANMFQVARYDGKLKGTEVGMVLFYTDLLMKFWGQNYLDNAPTHEDVEDFKPQTSMVISRIHREELKHLSGTRSWLGVADRGYQLGANKKSLYFAPNVTRLFNKSSNALDPRNESAANAMSQMFGGWWNDHMEDIARYEPEYQRLNEILKWSLLVAWVSTESPNDPLRFLNGVTVDREAWFPDWAKKKNLRFKDWDKVGFRHVGFLGKQTEVMRSLKSLPYYPFGDKLEAWNIRGGVSGANRDWVKIRPALPPDLQGKPFVRSNLDYTKVGNVDRLTTFTKSTFDFEQASKNHALLRVTAEPNAKLRTAMLDVPNRPFERILTRDGTTLRVGAKLGESDVGALAVTPASKGFRVTWQGGEMEIANAIARDFSTGSFAMGRNPLIEVNLQMPGFDHHLVKIHGIENWLKLEVPKKPGIVIPDGVAARVGDTGMFAAEVHASWVPEAKVRAEMHGMASLSVQIPRFGERTALIRLETRVLKIATVKFSLKNGDLQLHGQVNTRSGEVFFKPTEMPKALVDNPRGLTRLFESPEVRDLSAKMLKDPNKAVNLELSRPVDVHQPPPGRPTAEAIARNPEQAQRQLANDRVRALQQFDALLEQGRSAQARLILDELISIHGRRPDLLLRQALVELRMNRPNGAAELLNGEQALPTIAGELTRSNLPAAQVHEMEVLAGFAARDAAGGARPSLTPGAHGRLEHTATLAPSALGSPVDPVTLNRGAKTVVYVQDGAGLHNLDFSPAMLRDTLNQTIAGGQVDVHRLSRASVGELNPTTIYERPAANPKFSSTGDTKPPIRYQLKTESKRTAAFMGRQVISCMPIFGTTAAIAFCAPPPKDDDKEEEEILLLRSKFKGDKVVFSVEGKLTKDDPLDKQRKDSHFKVHAIKLEAGRTYTIDLVSPRTDEFIEPFLRLEDAKGVRLADDNLRADLNARIVYRPTRSDTYQVIVTTSVAGVTGSYTLTVRE